MTKHPGGGGGDLHLVWGHGIRRRRVHLSRKSRMGAHSILIYGGTWCAETHARLLVEADRIILFYVDDVHGRGMFFELLRLAGTKGTTKGKSSSKWWGLQCDATLGRRRCAFSAPGPPPAPCPQLRLTGSQVQRLPVVRSRSWRSSLDGSPWVPGSPTSRSFALPEPTPNRLTKSIDEPKSPKVDFFRICRLLTNRCGLVSPNWRDEIV